MVGEGAMHRLKLALVCGLWLTACSKGSIGFSPAGATEKGNVRSAHGGARCKSSSDCPSGQRCGFTGAMGCAETGKCVVEKKGASCFDPAGRCGCDGLPVDLFCVKGTTSEFASAPVNAVGPCPRPCSDDQGCASGLVCQKSGICGRPQDDGQKAKPRAK